MTIAEARKRRIVEEDTLEIRLDIVLQFLKQSRKRVSIWGGSFFVLGILFAMSKQNEYTAIVKVMPELKTSAAASTGGLGDLKSLAGLAGINLGSLGGTSEAIRPDLYPDIIKSIPLSLYLLKQSVLPIDAKKTETLEDYFIANERKGFIGFISGFFREPAEKQERDHILTQPNLPLKLTQQQERLCKIINERVLAEMDKKSGIITITAEMPDPIISATVARQTLDYLTNYVTSYRTGKARKQVQFLADQVKGARQRYELSELELSAYRDKNRNVFLNTAKIEEQRMQADYLLAQGVYSDLSKQLEQAKIKVEEESPVFQVLEPARVPIKKSGPKRTMIIGGVFLVGIIIGLLISLIRYFVLN